MHTHASPPQPPQNPVAANPPARSYLVNGCLMTLSFFLSRNVFGNYMSYRFFVDSAAELARPRRNGFSAPMIHAFR